VARVSLWPAASVTGPVIPGRCTWHSRCDRDEAELSAPDTIIHGYPATVIDKRSATFQVSSTIAGSRLYCRVDASPWFECTSGRASYTNLPQGQHTFEVYATYGVVFDPSPAKWTFAVADWGPDVAITAASVTATRATFSLSAFKPGVTFRCRVGTTAFTPCASPVAYTGMPSGSRQVFRVYGVDAAGTAGFAISYAFTMP
jgi:hypothetical protein